MLSMDIIVFFSLFLACMYSYNYCTSRSHLRACFEFGFSLVTSYSWNGFIRLRHNCKMDVVEPTSGNYLFRRKA